jgi:hypothetical protein
MPIALACCRTASPRSPQQSHTLNGKRLRGLSTIKAHRNLSRPPFPQDGISLFPSVTHIELPTLRIALTFIRGMADYCRRGKTIMIKLNGSAC